MNCPEYFQMVEARIAQEEERAEAYLDVSTTSPKLLRIVDDVFVSRQVCASKYPQLHCPDTNICCAKSSGPKISETYPSSFLCTLCETQAA